MEKIKAFAYNNPVRVAAFVSATVALVASFLVPDVPTETVVAFVLSALGLVLICQFSVVFIAILFNRIRTFVKLTLSKL